jgi:hypothetical protein
MAAIMAGMGVAEGVAVAAPWAQRELSSGQRPEQRWGTAAGRSHEAAVDATDASAGGGRSGHVNGKGELAPDTGFPTQPLITAALRSFPAFISTTQLGGWNGIRNAKVPFASVRTL